MPSTDAPTATPPAPPSIPHTTPAPPAINPWLFVPVLYFMQFLPNGIVTSLFSPIYKSLGVDNLRIATWTGLAALPWVFKMFWGPLVDVNSTKRRWTLTMQVAIAATLVLTTVAMGTPVYFTLTVAAMFLIATFSATHDIACDGLYLMSLDKKRQAAFSGVMAASSRLGRLFIDSLLVFFAGWLVSHAGYGQQTAWVVALAICTALYAGGTVWDFLFLPRPPADVPAVDVAPGERTRNVWRTLTIVAAGVVAYYFVNGLVQLAGHAIFQSVPAGRVPTNWNQTGDIPYEIAKLAAGVLLAPVLWLLIRKQVSGTPMADAFVTYARQPGFPAILCFIVFYRFGEAMIFAMASLFILDKTDAGGMGLTLQHLGMIKGIGQVVGLMVGGLLGGWYISRVGLRRAFWPLVVCMHVPNILYVWAASYPRWIAAQSVHLPDWPLLLTLIIVAGCAVWGVAKVRTSSPKTPVIFAAAAFAAYAIARSFYPASTMFGWRAATQWHSVALDSWPLYPVVFAEAFGYGVGFAGYFVYLMHVAQRGKFVTSHYAIGTGLGALFITFATILAGIIQSVWGYTGVFLAACIFTIPGTLTLLFIPMDEEQTKQVKAEAGH